MLRYSGKVNTHLTYLPKWADIAFVCRRITTILRYISCNIEGDGVNVATTLIIKRDWVKGQIEDAAPPKRSCE